LKEAGVEVLPAPAQCYCCEALSTWEAKIENSHFGDYCEKHVDRQSKSFEKKYPGTFTWVPRAKTAYWSMREGFRKGPKNEVELSKDTGPAVI
jgi:hypothetical protein